jgi:hypothetical protein
MPDEPSTTEILVAALERHRAPKEREQQATREALLKALEARRGEQDGDPKEDQE